MKTYEHKFIHLNTFHHYLLDRNQDDRKSTFLSCGTSLKLTIPIVAVIGHFRWLKLVNFFVVNNVLNVSLEEVQRGKTGALWKIVSSRPN